MDSKTGRSQTTLGVWMDAGTNANNLVVMDLEGTDSTERGEDRVVHLLVLFDAHFAFAFLYLAHTCRWLSSVDLRTSEYVKT